MAKAYNIKFTAHVPTLLTGAERVEIGRKVIDHILYRTRSQSKDKDGNSFPGYTKGYKKSLDFRNANKTGKVTLTLTGDMLDTLDILSHGEGYIDIGYETGSGEADKVEGNVIGSYGRTANASKARDFLGISESALKTIVDEVVAASPEERAIMAFVNSPTANQQINAILQNVGLEPLQDIEEGF